jgi:hypothetical protein
VRIPNSRVGSYVSADYTVDLLCRFHSCMGRLAHFRHHSVRYDGCKSDTGRKIERSCVGKRLGTRRYANQKKSLMVAGLMFVDLTSQVQYTSCK